MVYYLKKLRLKGVANRETLFHHICYLTAAEILALLIKMNPEIIGIKVNTKEFKLTQFADDTALFLDGTQHSLQAALNTLEIFGNFSGLRMNKEKTKIIWIGRKRFSKFKLNVSQKLDWGCTDFTFLGLHFSVNLDDMCKINYSKTIKIAEAEIIKWQTRNLTPIGKITIIKTKILSKFIHLFLSIPITKCFLENLNRILFQFLWNKKPDKIKRATICLSKRRA